MSGLIHQNRRAVSLLLIAVIAVTALLHRSMFLLAWHLTTAPIAAFFFPVELEREGSVWLHVLAQLSHVDIYDHRSVAFVNMNHGPIDPLLKYYVALLLPDLSAWQVVRIFVVVLPGSLVVGSAILLREQGGRPAWVLGTAVGLATYIVMVSSRGALFLLSGRSDPTAHVLVVALIVTVAESLRASTRTRHLILAGVGGILMSATYLTVWRSVPAVGAIFIIYCVTLAVREHRVRAVLPSAAVVIAAALVFLIVVLISLFGRNVGLFYEHFYGFFFTSPPPAPSPTYYGLSADRIEDLHATLQDIARLGRHLWIISLPLIVLLAGYLLRLSCPHAVFSSAFYSSIVGATYAMTFGVLCVGYWLNFRGGSLVYISLTYLLGWYILCAFISSLPFSRTEGALAASIIVISIAIGRNSGFPGDYIRRDVLAKMDGARAFSYELSELRSRYEVISDSYHFFKKGFTRDDKIDMGDAVLSSLRDHVFDPTFDDTVKDYIRSLRQHPPDIIVLGFASAQPIRALADSRYVCVACGVRFFAGGERDFALYARNDLPIAELRTIFAPFAAPSP